MFLVKINTMMLGTESLVRSREIWHGRHKEHFWSGKWRNAVQLKRLYCLNIEAPQFHHFFESEEHMTVTFDRDEIFS